MRLGPLWRRREQLARDRGEVEERYRMLIDRLPATVAVWDKRTRVVDGVPAACVLA
jgi:PAS domain-containing protein